MNCFHFSVSLGYKTTREKRGQLLRKLWIAFIFQYLWDTKQHKKDGTGGGLCCELLSFFSIFGIQNNDDFSQAALRDVVNCFHFSVSLGYKTTPEPPANGGETLWIAFIFQYLWDTKQRLESIRLLRPSCELLSFFSIFGIQNNIKWIIILPIIVVNCFHFSVSLGYKTTIFDGYYTNDELWIAFIFQYLWDTKQLAGTKGYNDLSCELLSFFSIFGIQNNPYQLLTKMN